MKQQPSLPKSHRGQTSDRCRGAGRFNLPCCTPPMSCSPRLWPCWPTSPGLLPGFWLRTHKDNSLLSATPTLQSQISSRSSWLLRLTSWWHLWNSSSPSRPSFPSSPHSCMRSNSYNQSLSQNTYWGPTSLAESWLINGYQNWVAPREQNLNDGNLELIL